MLALLSSVLWGTADFVGGTVSRRLPAPLVVGLSQFAGLLAISLVAATAGALDAPTGYLPWAVGAGLAGLTGLVCFYAALAMGTMGIVSPIAAVGVAVPVVVGIAQGERPGSLQVAGIVIAIAGIVLASGPELSGRAGAVPLLLAAVAAVGFGLALLFIAKGSESSTLMTLVTMRATSVAVMALALGVMARRTLVRPTGGDYAVIAVVGLADVAANLTFGLASTRGLVSVVAVLGSLYPVATALLARFVHSERLAPLQVAGVSAALAGVACIAAG